jgi:hypothetical protein
VAAALGQATSSRGHTNESYQSGLFFSLQPSAFRAVQIAAVVVAVTVIRSHTMTVYVEHVTSS